MPPGFSRRKKADTSDSHQYLPDDVVILLLGVTGSGKSTFINEIIGCPKAKVSDALLPVGIPVTSFLASIPPESQCPQHENSRLILVDTPGLDANESHQDMDILAQIESWILHKYGKSKKFSGIVYLHDISEKRMRHSSVLNLNRLKDLCGENHELKLVMATTHWDKVKTDDGAHREIELLEHFWKILNGRNTKMMRLEPDTWRQDAYRAIDFILGITAPSRGEAPKRGNDKWRLKIIQEDDTFFETGRVDDLIIAIMGSTGVGKSTFLNNAARLYTKDPACFSDPSPVGHSLESCTRNVLHHIAILPRNHPLFPGRRIVFVDTPGFGDTHQDDSDILRRIAAWLANSYSRNAYLAGLIYLSDISQKRVFGSERLNLDVFRKVCGQEFTRIAVATTHWDTVQRLKGEEREGELRKAFWRELIEQGATVHRVEKTPEDVGSIIDAILQAVAKDTRAQVLQIQAELVDMEKTIPLTEAGTKLRHNLRELVDLYKHQLGATSTDQEQKQLEKDIALALDQIERLSVPLTDRVKNWFRGL